MIRDYRDTFFQCCIGQVFGTSSNGLYREENCFALVKVLFRGFDVGARGVVWSPGSPRGIFGQQNRFSGKKNSKGIDCPIQDMLQNNDLGINNVLTYSFLNTNTNVLFLNCIFIGRVGAPY